MRRFRWIAFIAILSVLAGAAQAERRVALVVGNSAYRHTVALDNPRNDAADMAATLKKHGFHVIEGLDLGKAAFDRKVGDFAVALKGADAGVFFYAGHGLQVAGRNYLVPIDAKAEEAALLNLEMVRVDTVHAIMEEQTKTNILFLDACRDNPLARNLARSMGTRSAEVGRGLAEVKAGVGTLISFSTQPGNVALDGTGRNSPYTGALVSRLGTSREDLSAILIDVRNDVMRATRDRQVPWEHVALRARFYFGALPAPKGSNPAGLTPGQTGAALEWSRVDKSSLAELETFRRRHPKSPEAEYAQARIDELERAKVALTVPSAPKPEASPSVAPAPDSTLPHVSRQPSRVEVELFCREVRKSTNTALLQAQLPSWSGPMAACLQARLDELKRVELAKQAVEAAKKPDKEVARRDPALSAKPGSGESFRDCPECPEMVVVPAGSFTMGSPAGEEGRFDREGPQHRVAIAQPFAVGKFEVTFGEWGACVRAGGCQYRPDDYQDLLGDPAKRPVANVSWDDITKEYLPWLSHRTGKAYRLLTEAEWEYAARAGTTGRWSFEGDEANLCEYGNHADRSSPPDISIPWRNTRCSDTRRGGRVADISAAVGSYRANAFGLHDMHGNVWEWVEDCYHDSYSGAPSDGSAWTAGNCSARVLRGGAFGDAPRFLRSANRNASERDARGPTLGFRVARTF